MSAAAPIPVSESAGASGGESAFEASVEVSDGAASRADRLSGWALRLAGWGLLAAGIVTLGLALKMPAKAALGYYLLDRAWAETLAAGPAAAPVRPWPGADMAPVARIAFPTLDAERVVLDTASGEAMAWGAGHVQGTAAPGKPGVAGIAAHRDSHFALLAQLGPGDDVMLETRNGETQRYRVEGAQVVDARHWRFPALFEGPEVLALLTCWPVDALVPGDERLVVYARRIADETVEENPS